MSYKRHLTALIMHNYIFHIHFLSIFCVINNDLCNAQVIVIVNYFCDT
ncbi:hypothetical protein PMSV_3254 [Photobacterium leiognathi subsp. mandapamensis svers.1.1.]|nr:hypothetical protein PMSV_3254 [Photobacterium leiognathi subsp. mandapamensis svers.1.1.]